MKYYLLKIAIINNLIVDMASVNEGMYNTVELTQEMLGIIRGCFEVAKNIMPDGVFYGRSAIFYLCMALHIEVEVDLLSPTAIEMYYLGNTQRVTRNSFGLHWHRKNPDSPPSRVVTYSCVNNMDINIHLLNQGGLRYIMVDGFNFLAPLTMQNHYYDDLQHGEAEYKYEVYLLRKIQQKLLIIAGDKNFTHQMYNPKH